MFANFKQNNLARLLTIAVFAYKNAKNASTKYISFKLNYSYYLYTPNKKNVNFCFLLKLAEKLANKLRNLMTIYRKNFEHAQKLKK